MNFTFELLPNRDEEKQDIPTYLLKIQFDEKSFKNVKVFKRGYETVKLAQKNLFSKMKVQSVQD